MATALDKTVSQDLSLLTATQKVNFPSSKVLKKYVEKFSSHNLIQPKVLHKDIFILVKLPSPAYSGLLLGTEPYKWVVGRIIEVFDQNVVKIEIITEKVHQLTVYLKRDTGWSEVPKLVTADKASWIDQLLRSEQDVEVDPVENVVAQQDLVPLIEDASIITLLKKNIRKEYPNIQDEDVEGKLLMVEKVQEDKHQEERADDNEQHSYDLGSKKDDGTYSHGHDDVSVSNVTVSGNLAELFPDSNEEKGKQGIIFSLDQFSDLKHIDSRFIRFELISKRLYKIMRKIKTAVNEIVNDKQNIDHHWHRLESIIQMLNKNQDEYESLFKIFEQIADGRDPIFDENNQEEEVTELILSLGEFNFEQMQIKIVEIRGLVLAVGNTLNLGEETLKLINHGMSINLQELGTQNGTVVPGFDELLQEGDADNNVGMGSKNNFCKDQPKIKRDDKHVLKNQLNMQAMMKILEDQQRLMVKQEDQLKMKQIQADKLLSERLDQLERMSLRENTHVMDNALKVKNKSVNSVGKETNDSERSISLETENKDIASVLTIIGDQVRLELQKPDISRRDSTILFDLDVFISIMQEAQQSLQMINNTMEENEEADSSMEKASGQLKKESRSLLDRYNNLRKEAWGSGVGTNVQEICRLVEKCLNKLRQDISNTTSKNRDSKLGQDLSSFKLVKLDELHLASHKSPGLFLWMHRLKDRMKTIRCADTLWLQKILNSLRETEPSVLEEIVNSHSPTTTSDLTEKIMKTYGAPKLYEKVLTNSLAMCGRLNIPNEANIKREYEKMAKVTNIMMNVTLMREYYTKNFPDNAEIMLSQGVFRSDFVTILLKVFPQEQTIKIMPLVAVKNPFQQLEIINNHLIQHSKMLTTYYRDHYNHDDTVLSMAAQDRSTNKLEDEEPEDKEKSQSKNGKITAKTGWVKAKMAKQENEKVMKLFNKLANNEQIEDSSVQNMGLETVDSVEKASLKTNKEKAMFLLMAHVFPRTCKMCINMQSNQETKNLLRFPHLFHNIKEGFYRPSSISFCPNFFRIESAESRKTKVSDMNGCFSCLKSNHNAGKCFGPGNAFCKNCKVHFMIGDCATCVERVKKNRDAYQKVFSSLAKGESKTWMLMQKQDKIITMHSQQKGVAFDRIIQKLQEVDSGCKEAKRIDLRHQSLDHIPEVVTMEHEMQIAALSNSPQSNPNIMTYEDMTRLIKPRTDEDPILIWVSIPGVHGKSIRGLLDSATTECIIQSKVIEEGRFLHKFLGSNWLEVVGGNRKLQQTYSLAVPINNDEVFKYMEIRAIALDKIVDDIEMVDVTHTVNEAFEAYKNEKESKGEPVLYPRHLWPTGTIGGGVEALFGIRCLKLNIIFHHQNLTFFTCNLGEQSRVYMGGSMKTNGNYNASMLSMVRSISQPRRNNPEATGVLPKNECQNKEDVVCPCRYNEDLNSMCKSSKSYIWHLEWGNDVLKEDNENAPTNVKQKGMTTAALDSNVDKKTVSMEHSNKIAVALNESEFYLKYGISFLEDIIQSETDSSNEDLCSSGHSGAIENEIADGEEIEYRMKTKSVLETNNGNYYEEYEKICNRIEVKTNWDFESVSQIMQSKLNVDPGWIVCKKKIDPDGNCFIASCVAGLYNSLNVSKDITKLFNNILVNSYDSYFDKAFNIFPTEVIHGDRKKTIIETKEEHMEFLQNKEGEVVWRDTPEIIAFASIFNVDIFIHKEVGKKVETLEINPNEKHSLILNNLKKEIHLAYNGNHYDILCTKRQTYADVCRMNIKTNLVLKEELEKESTGEPSRIHKCNTLSIYDSEGRTNVNPVARKMNEWIEVRKRGRKNASNNIAKSHQEPLIKVTKEKVTGIRKDKDKDLRKKKQDLAIKLVGGGIDKDDLKESIIKVSVPVVDETIRRIKAANPKIKDVPKIITIISIRSDESLDVLKSWVDNVKLSIEKSEPIETVLQFYPLSKVNGKSIMKIRVKRIKKIINKLKKERHLNIFNARPNKFVELESVFGEDDFEHGNMKHYMPIGQVTISLMTLNKLEYEAVVSIPNPPTKYNIIVQEPLANITKHKAEIEYKAKTQQNTKELLNLMKLHINSNKRAQELEESIPLIKILDMTLERNSKVYRLINHGEKLYFLRQVPIYGEEQRESVSRENETTIDSESNLCPICGCDNQNMKEHLLYNHNLIRVFLDDAPYNSQVLLNPDSHSKEENISCDRCKFKLHQSLPLLMAHHQLLECDENMYKDFIESMKIYTVKAVNICSTRCMNEYCDICMQDSTQSSSDNDSDEEERKVTVNIKEKKTMNISLCTSLHENQNEDNICKSGNDCIPLICDCRRFCSVKRGFCPYIDSRNIERINEILHNVESDHTMDDKCIITQIKSMASVTDESTARKIKENIENIMKEFLQPDEPVNKRCNSCKKCFNCGGAASNQAIGKKRKQMQEDQELKNSISITQDKANAEKYRVVATLPVQTDYDDYLPESNYNSALQEFDRKMIHLDAESKRQLQSEFDKMCNSGYYVSLSELDPTVQRWVLNCKTKNYLSVAPQWKYSSKSTKCRTACNASRKTKKTNKSLNELMATGANELALDVTFRRFKTSNITAVADIKKFYMNVYVNQSSLPLQLLLWRKDLNPKEPPKIYVITRLQYGVRSSARLAALSLHLICTFGEQKCQKCQGKFSFFEDRDTEIKCDDISHKFSKCISYSYVDDVVLEAVNEKEMKEMTSYGTSLLAKFGFEFKGIDISKQTRTLESETLDETGSLLFTGYRWWPDVDKISLKIPELHNGTFHRGRMVDDPDQVDNDGEIVPVEAILFDDVEKMNPKVIDQLFRHKVKTLRLVTSLASKTFDICGLAAPLISQIKKTVSKAIEETSGEWDSAINDDLWGLFLLQLVEIMKTSLYKYDRVPSNIETKDKLTLIIQSDASTSLIICIHVLFPTSDGLTKTSLLLGKSYLKHTNLTIPKAELQSFSKAASIGLQVARELKAKVKRVIFGSDSLVSLYWIVSTKKNLEVFVRNRVENVRSCLEKIHEDIDTHDNTDTLEKDMNYLENLFWVKSKYLTPDLGTKYATTDDLVKENGKDIAKQRILEHKDVSPDSEWYVGPQWATDIQGYIRNKKIEKMTTVIKNDKKLTDEEMENFAKGLLKTKKIENNENVLDYGKLTPVDVTTSLALLSKDTNLCTRCNTPTKNTVCENNGCLMILNNSKEVQKREKEADNFMICLASKSELGNNPSTTCPDVDLIEDVAHLALMTKQANKKEQVLIQKRSEELHYQPCTVTVNNETLSIGWIVDYQPMKRWKFSYTLKVMVLVVSAVLKFKTNHLKLLKCIDEDLTEKNSSVLSFTNAFERTIIKLPETAMVLSDKAPHPIHPSLLGTRTNIPSGKVIDRDDFITIRNRQQKTIFEHPCDNLAKHPRIKNTARAISKIYNRVNRDGEKWSKGVNVVYQELGADKDTVIQVEFLNFVSDSINDIVAEFNIVQTESITNRSDVSDIVNQDVNTLMRWMQQVDFGDLYIRIEERTGWQHICNINSQNQSDKIRLIRKANEYVGFSSCFRHKQQLLDAMKVISNLIAYKGGQELQNSASKKQIDNHCMEVRGQFFAINKFSNAKRQFSEHNEAMQSILESLGFQSFQLVFSPFSSISYAIARTVHELTLVTTHRPSVTRGHAGVRKTMIQIRKKVEILSLPELVKNVIKKCILCIKGLCNFATVPTGKIQAQFLPGINAAFQVQYIDLLTNVKLKAIPRNMQTRSMPTIEVNVVIAVCALTRFVTFAIVHGKSVNSMAQALSSIAAATAPPMLWLADRESALMTLFRQGRWVVDRGSAAAEGFTVQLCPALGSSHVNHSIVERRVQSLKLSFGRIDFTGCGWDPVIFNNFITILQGSLNDTPIANRIHPRDQSTYDCNLLDIITPNILAGRNYPRVLTTLSISKDPNDYIFSLRNAQSMIDNIIADYLIGICKRQREAGDETDRGQQFEPGDLVAFKRKDRDLAGSFVSVLKYGVVAKCEKPGIDGVSRSLFIQTSGSPGEVLDGEEIQRSSRFTVHRRNDQCILLERPGEFQQEFGTQAKCVEDIINLRKGAADDQVGLRDKDEHPRARHNYACQTSCCTMMSSILLQNIKGVSAERYNEQEYIGTSFSIITFMVLLLMIYGWSKGIMGGHLARAYTHLIAVIMISLHAMGETLIGQARTIGTALLGHILKKTARQTPTLALAAAGSSNQLEIISSAALATSVGVAKEMTSAASNLNNLNWFILIWAWGRILQGRRQGNWNVVLCFMAIIVGQATGTFINAPLSRVIGIKGEDLEINCNRSTYTQWERLGGKIPSNARIKGTQDEILLLLELKEEDIGTYVCSTMSKEGNQKEMFIVSVKEESRTSFIDSDASATLLPMTGFDCNGHPPVELARVSLSYVKRCKKAMFEHYTRQNNDIKEWDLLNQQRTIKFRAKRCELHASISAAYCRENTYKGFSGGIDGYKGYFQGLIKVTREQCGTLWDEGIFQLDLGSEVVTFDGIPADSMFTTSRYIFGSNVESDHGCAGSSIKFAYLPNGRAFSPESKVVEITLRSVLDKELGLYDFFVNTANFARLGLFVTSNDQKITIENNVRYGTVIADLNMARKCPSWSMILQKASGELFMDLTVSKGSDETHPPVLVLETQDKKVALQLLDSTKICERLCYATQIKSLMVCQHSNDSISDRINEQQFSELSSNPLLFLQYNLAGSIGQMLWNECLFREKFLISILSNFKSQGSHIVGSTRGILADELGETGIILSCRAVLVNPRQIEPNRCCTNLPVSEGNRRLFMTPRSRILVDVCSDTECSANFPVVFTHDEQVSVCQYADGPSICRSAEVLDPSRDLSAAKLKTLTVKESDLGSAFRFDSDIRNIASNTITEFNARTSTLGVIMVNTAKCNNSVFCTGARQLPTGLRKEFGRSVSSWLSFLLNFTDFGITVQYVTFSWAAFCMIGGLVDFFRRIKEQMSEVLSRGGMNCCSFFMLIAAQMMISINPFNRRDSLTESKIRQIQGVLDNMGKSIEEIQKMNRRLNLQLDILDAQVENLARPKKEHDTATRNAGRVSNEGILGGGCGVTSFKNTSYQVPRSILARKDQNPLEHSALDCDAPLLAERNDESYECMVYRSAENVSD